MAILSKLSVMGECILEIVMFVYEYCQLHNLKKQAIAVVVYYNEAERRRFFAKRYACKTSLWLIILACGCAMAYLGIDKIDCRPDQAVEWDNICQNC